MTVNIPSKFEYLTPIECDALMDVVKVFVVKFSFMVVNHQPCDGIFSLLGSYALILGFYFSGGPTGRRNPFGLAVMGGPRWSLQAAFAKATCALAESNRRIMQCQESPTSI